MNLKINSVYWNPWMPNAYHDRDSCQKTIAHFKECRQYGCWNDRNSKWNCDDLSCKYHPENPTKMKNKCDLNKGVIWRRDTPERGSEYELGQDYLEIIETELLGNRPIPLRLLISTFYPREEFDCALVKKF